MFLPKKKGCHTIESKTIPAVDAFPIQQIGMRRFIDADTTLAHYNQWLAGNPAGRCRCGDVVKPPGGRRFKRHIDKVEIGQPPTFLCGTCDSKWTTRFSCRFIVPTEDCELFLNERGPFQPGHPGAVAYLNEQAGPCVYLRPDKIVPCTTFLKTHPDKIR